MPKPNSQELYWINNKSALQSLLLAEYDLSLNASLDKLAEYSNKVFEIHPNSYYRYKTIVLPNSAALKAHNRPLVCSKEYTDKIHELADTYFEEFNNRDRLQWYIRRVVNEASSEEEVKKCLPPHLHSTVESAYCQFCGMLSAEQLRIDEFYDLLEQAPLKNVLQGI